MPISIRYEFRFDDGREEIVDLQLHGKTLELIAEWPASLPAWTRTGFNQCGNCPFSISEDTHCPLAASLVDIVRRFDCLASYTELDLTVVTRERTVSQRTSAQNAISSLMGLVIATCGCPHTAYFRPMARYHLPLANEDETSYRSTSMYLLAQYFRHIDGLDADLDLAGLKRIYANVRRINLAILERLRAVTVTDSSANAIILLDAYAQALPLFIEESIEDLRPLFAAYTERPLP